MDKELQKRLKRFRKRILQAPISTPPLPWQPISLLHIGGITNVGFSPDTDLLLVITHAGRGVIDCKSGEKIARDNAVEGDWFDPVRLVAEGIGPLQGVSVRLAGIHGGGLPSMTDDLWRVECETLDWPDRTVILLKPCQSIYDENSSFAKLLVDSEIRAAGFSYTGQFLIIATSSELTVFGRDL